MEKKYAIKRDQGIFSSSAIASKKYSKDLFDDGEEDINIGYRSHERGQIKDKPIHRIPKAGDFAPPPQVMRTDDKDGEKEGEEKPPLEDERENHSSQAALGSIIANI